MLQTQHHSNSHKNNPAHGLNLGGNSCTRPRALSRGNSNIFKFERVAESCASLFADNTSRGFESSIQGGVAKDDLINDIDQPCSLDFLGDFPISDSDSALPLTRSDSNNSNTSLPLSVFTEMFYDTVAQSPRPEDATSPLSVADADIIDIINDIPTSPFHASVRSHFEKQSPKHSDAVAHTAVGREFEKQSTIPCDAISKPSTKVCPTILKQSTKHSKKESSGRPKKRKRKSRPLPSMMQEMASNRKRKRRGKSIKWSKDEDQRLLDAVKKFDAEIDAVKKFGMKWNAVAAVVGSRTPIQCGQRWRKSLRPELANVKKGLWCDSEDDRLRELVSSLGTEKTWHNIAEGMGYTRTPKQCKERWHNFLDPKLRVEWSDDEDKKLVSLFKKYGAQWADIAKELCGRTGDRVKRRLRKIYSNNNEVLVY